MKRRDVSRAHGLREPGNAPTRNRSAQQWPLSWWSVVVLLVVTGPAAASYVKYDFSELLEHSPRIVTGELVGTGQLDVAGVEASRRIGVLSVEANLKGSGQPGIVFLALPDPPPGVATSTVTHEVGQKGLWFLRQPDGRDDDLYLADHPQRFEALPDARDKIERIREHLGSARGDASP